MKKLLSVLAAMVLLSTVAVSASAHHSGKAHHTAHSFACVYSNYSATATKNPTRCTAPFVCIDTDGDNLCDNCSNHCQAQAEICHQCGNAHHSNENCPTSSCHTSTSHGRGNGHHHRHHSS